MERATNPSSGPKVSQIANIFQRKSTEMEELPSDQIKDHQQHQPQPPIPGGRAESHSTRFNNARALFEKLGVENRVPRPAALSLKMTNSSSKEDNLGESSPDHDRIRTPSPKHNKYPAGNNIGNGVPKRDPTKIHNAFRNKAEKPEKPEKPERKFNSKELIEKQKNWTSHFTKARTTRFNSDPNRCDIIRTVPGTGLYSNNDHPSVETCRTSSVPPTNNTTTANNITTGHTNNSNPAVAQINNNYNNNNNNNSSVTTGHSNYTAGSNNINTTNTTSAVMASSKSTDIPARPNSPPNPPVRQHSIPPEVKPRNNRPMPSPCKSPPPPIPLNKPQICSPVKSGFFVGYDPVAAKTSPVTGSKHDDDIAEKRKRSLDLIDDDCDQLMDSTSSSTTNSSTTAAPITAEYAQVKKYSIDSALGSVSPGHAISSSPSPAPSASSGPSSPIHTEDEKQENESTEKAEMLMEEYEPAQREYSFHILTLF